MLNVLIIKPSSLGDIIHSAPAVERIARSRVDCRVTWVVNEEYAAFARELPGVFAVLPFPRREFHRQRFPFWIPRAFRWLAALHGGGFDIAIDLQGLQRSGLMTRASGAAERFGPRPSRELAWMHYNRPISIPDDLPHAVDRLNHMIRAVTEESALLGARRPIAADTPFRLAVPAWAREEARQLLGDGDGRRVVALCPGTRWASKRWTSEGWASLLRHLARESPDLRPVFLGAPGEEPLALDVLALEPAAAENLVGKGSLWRTAAVFERAAAVITMDSAPLHLAAAVGTPTVALFGPTDPARVAPRGPLHRVVRRDLDCLGCYQRECPLPQRICLPDLSADEVLAALASVLQSP